MGPMGVDHINNRDYTMSDQEVSIDSAAIEPPALADDMAVEGLKVDLAEHTFVSTDDDEALTADVAERPIDVPEKFWNSSANTVRIDALLKSYLQLEKKLGTMVALPSDDDPVSRERLHRALGRPNSPEDYKIEAPHELLSSDPEINSKLHNAGLTSKQAQLVYDLAAEHMLPIIEKVNVEANQAQDVARLTSHFGGEQSWQAIAPQIKSWAEANLNEEVHATLGSSFDGIVAIHQMMQNREPSMISEAAVPAAGINKDTLNQMMRDPRYWRDHDPAFVNRVTEGYKQLYG